MWQGVAFKIRRVFTTFLKWRIRHLDDHRFIIILSVFLGFETGIIVVLLKRLIYFIKDLLDATWEWVIDERVLYLLLPVVGIVITLLVVKFFAGGKLDRGISFILYSIGRNNSVIKAKHKYLQVITSAFTVGFGGSVGLEAPVVVTGAAWGSYYGKLFHLNHRQTTILIGCGAAAAISAIFNAPVAGVIFVMEVIIANINIVFIVPLLISAVMGTFISDLLMGEDAFFRFTTTEDVRNIELLFFVILGIICGMLSIYFNTAIYWVQNKIIHIRNQAKKMFLGGIILGLMILILPTLYGEGYITLTQLIKGDEWSVFKNTIFESYAGNQWLLVVFLLLSMMLKVVAAGLTRALGGVGGVFAPAMFTGGLAGFIFARVLNLIFPELALSEINFLLVGMAGVSSGLLHSPLTKIFLVAEITQGYELLVPLMILAAVSFAVKVYFDSHSFYTKELAKRGDYILNDKDKTVLQDIKMASVIERNFVSVHEDQKLGDLVNAIAKSERNIFPVVGENRSLKGIILLNDVRKLIFKPELYKEKEIKYLMKKPPAVIEIGEKMESVMDKFDKTNAWNLPVTNNGQYEGFLSKSKIFSIYRSQLKTLSKELG
ncbi:MAG: chloride channel protein [Thalassobius sp.]|nr:chloride channel protein [Thalassovita sp.]